MPPLATISSTGNGNWYDALASSAASVCGDKTFQEPLQLVPNVFNDFSNGLPYPEPVHAHPHMQSHSGFPIQMTDSSAFHPTPMPIDKMPISSHFYGGATSFDANVRPENTAVFAEPLNGYAPCQGPRPWNFAQCYGFYGEPACPLVDIIDIEDFMWVCFSTILSHLIYQTEHATHSEVRFRTMSPFHAIISGHQITDNLSVLPPLSRHIIHKNPFPMKLSFLAFLQKRNFLIDRNKSHVFINETIGFMFRKHQRLEIRIIRSIAEGRQRLYRHVSHIIPQCKN